jgi:HD-GYP domain-containing protein (c-di-GMP phosphodiesterase class II)
MPRRVVESEIHVGQPVGGPIADEAGTLLLNRGEIVRSEEHRLRLLREGYLLESDGNASRREQTQDSGIDGRTAAGYRLSIPDINVFAETRHLSSELQQLHRNLLSGQGRHLARWVLEVARRLTALFNADAAAATASLQLDVLDDNFASKQLHAGLICGLLSRGQGFSDTDALSITAAAITYDIALGPLQKDLNRNAGPLSPVQEKMVHQHPAQAVEVLRAAGVNDRIWLNAILQHHERPDGSGYPSGLLGDAIPLPARILGLADAYCTMIRPRAYRQPTHASEVIRTLFKESGKKVDASLCAQLVKSLGIFPPGTFVRLRNQEVAIVVRPGDHAAHPVICAVVNPYGELLQHPEPRDSMVHETMIVEAVPLHAFRSVAQFAPHLWG